MVYSIQLGHLEDGQAAAVRERVEDGSGAAKNPQVKPVVHETEPIAQTFVSVPGGGGVGYGDVQQ